MMFESPRELFKYSYRINDMYDFVVMKSFCLKGNDFQIQTEEEKITPFHANKSERDRISEFLERLENEY